MTKVFVSYRRDDSRASTGRIADRLRAKFGESAIFQDIESIKLGVDFRPALGDRLDQADVFLAIIGDEWMAVDDTGQRRVDVASDPVRLEIAAALKREGVPVIPVLVGSSPMPAEDDLPDELKDLHYRNAIEVPSDDTFDSQVARLIAAIEEIIGDGSVESSVEEALPESGTALELEPEPEPEPAPEPEPTPTPKAQQPVTRASSTGGSSFTKIGAAFVLVAAAAYGIINFFPCTVLGQCPNIFFEFDNDEMDIFYGDEVLVRMHAFDENDEPVREMPDLDGLYEFVWLNSDAKSLAIELLKDSDGVDIEGEPFARMFHGIPANDDDTGGSDVSVTIRNLENGTTQRPEIRVNLLYDERLLERATNAKSALADSTISTGDIARDLEEITTRERNRLPSLLLGELDAQLAAIGKLVSLRDAAENADSESTTVGARLSLWLSGLRNSRNSGDSILPP